MRALLWLEKYNEKGATENSHDSFIMAWGVKWIRCHQEVKEGATANSHESLIMAWEVQWRRCNQEVKESATANSHTNLVMAWGVQWKKCNQPLQWELTKTREIYWKRRNYPLQWGLIKTWEVCSPIFNDDGNEDDSKLEVRQTHQHLWMNDRLFQDQMSMSSSTKMKMWQTCPRLRWWREVLPRWKNGANFTFLRS